MIDRRTFLLGSAGVLKEIYTGTLDADKVPLNHESIERIRNGEVLPYKTAQLIVKNGKGYGRDETLQLGNIDLRVGELLEQPEEARLVPDLDAHARHLIGKLPYVTGFKSRFRLDVGHVDKSRIHGTSHLSSSAWDEKGWPATEQPKGPVNRYSTYLVADRFYDNKVVNASTAMIEMSESMMVRGVKPTETFSYLERAKIGEIVPNALTGYAIIGKKLTPVQAGGVCTSVTATAKAVRVFEHESASAVPDNFMPVPKVHIKRSQAHSVPEHQYYFNPEDPTPRQIDATAYYPSVDFQFVNRSDEELFVVPKINIIPDGSVPNWHSSLHNSSAWFVFSITIQNAPQSVYDHRRNKKQLHDFRALRGI